MKIVPRLSQRTRHYFSRRYRTLPFSEQVDPADAATPIHFILFTIIPLAHTHIIVLMVSVRMERSYTQQC